VISKFFIDRPVFASVLSIVIVLAGLVAMRALPISQYPQIVPPDVVVTANYPGATRAETIASTVAAPLEQQINGVERMIYMRSTSTGSGTMSLTISFEIGTNPDQNAINVNNRVQRALPAAAGRGDAPGRRGAEALDLDPDGDDHVVAGTALRHGVHQQLRAGQRDRRAAPSAGRRRCGAVRGLRLFHAHLASARQARAIQPHTRRRRRRDPRAEFPVCGRPLRRRADEEPADLHLLGDDARPAGRSLAVREHHHPVRRDRLARSG
jgi:hypothetical protein